MGIFHINSSEGNVKSNGTSVLVLLYSLHLQPIVSIRWGFKILPIVISSSVPRGFSFKYGFAH
jgi:hypothetical protein